MATLSEAEIQAQWKAGVAVLEETRAFVDGTLFENTGSGLFDILDQAARGDYLPEMAGRLKAAFRQSLSGLISPGMARLVLDPVLFDYGKIFAAASTTTEGRGAAYREAKDLFRALYEWLHDNGDSVNSRNITFDTTPDTENFSRSGGAIVGNGALSRLTVDEFGYPMEACTVERKQFICRRDQNTGAQEHAEVFEVMGEPAAPDSILRAVFGSGDQNRRALVSKNSGSGGGERGGGSLLRNSSFDSWDSNTSTFPGWTNTAGTGGSQIQFDGTNIYRRNPNTLAATATVGSLKLNSSGAGANITVTQPLRSFRDSRVDPNTPYFFRVMVNKAIGSGSGGSLVCSLGGVDITTALSAISGTDWHEIVIPFDESCWPRAFNSSGELEVSIDWQTSSSTGYLLIDDVILAPWDQVDGTFWCLRGNAADHVSWALDDVLSVTDTGGAPADAKLQWWCYVTGLGYLPSDNTGSETITDPT